MPHTQSSARAHLPRALRWLAVCSALPLAACSDQPTAPVHSRTPSSVIDAAAPFQGDRLATIEMEDGREVLYLQDADGSNRARVHFQNVHDHVTGNYSPRQLPVTDATITAIRRAKWSPDGRHLAVIVLPAFDAAQVVLVSADGHDLRTVSPNSQYLFGDVEWSPDSRRIAYAMATGPYAMDPDLFVTDLGLDRVRRVTTSGLLSGYDTFRFDQTGERIDFTEHLGWTDDDLNVLSRVSSADLTTGTVVDKGTLVGDPQGIARGGAWALVIRWNAEGGRELVRVPLAGGKETTLGAGDLWNAVLLEGDDEAILVTPADRDGTTRTFTLIGVDAPKDVRGTLPTGKAATWAALVRAER